MHLGSQGHKSKLELFYQKVILNLFYMLMELSVAGFTIVNFVQLMVHKKSIWN